MSGLTKPQIEKFIQNYLCENEYPDGPFEFVEISKVQHQIDIWRCGFLIMFELEYTGTFVYI